MKNRQFESFEAAIAYLESVGTLQYFGHIGYLNEEYHIYNLTTRGILYRLNVHINGKVEIRE